MDYVMDERLVNIVLQIIRQLNALFKLIVEGLSQCLGY